MSKSNDQNEPILGTVNVKIDPENTDFGFMSIGRSEQSLDKHIQIYWGDLGSVDRAKKISRMNVFGLTADGALEIADFFTRLSKTLSN